MSNNQEKIESEWSDFKTSGIILNKQISKNQHTWVTDNKICRDLYIDGISFLNKLFTETIENFPWKRSVYNKIPNKL